MKIAALIIGILGGIIGLGGSAFALFVGGIGGAFGAEGAKTVIGLGFLSIPFSILGIIGGALALSKPKAAGICMIISAIGGIIAISAGYIPAFLLLLVGGILALVSAKKAKKVSVVDKTEINNEL